MIQANVQQPAQLGRLAGRRHPAQGVEPGVQQTGPRGGHIDRRGLVRLERRGEDDPVFIVQEVDIITVSSEG